MKKILFPFITILLGSQFSFAQLSSTPFTAGNLVVGRFATNSATTSTARKTNLIEITTNTNTTPVQNFDLPFTGTNALTLDNTVTFGLITLSGNGQFISLVGYNVEDNGTNVIAATDKSVNRIVHRLRSNTSLSAYKMANSSASIGTTDPFDSVPVRSAYTLDGNKFFVAGGTTSNNATNSTGGVWYFDTLNPTTSSTQLHALSNTRFVIAQGSTLYSANAVVTTPNIPIGVQRIGDGTFVPTTAQSLTNLTPALTGSPTGVFVSPDGNTMYIGKNAAGGAIERWKNSSGTWSLQYIMANATAGRSLTARFNGNVVELYSVYAKNVVKITDTLTNTTATWSGTSTIIYTEADANLDLRGISFTPGTTNTGVLPATFGAITAIASSKTVSVGWSTLNEIAVANFGVQRSINGVDYTTVGSVVAKGSSNGFANYSYQDAFAVSQNTYYRIAVNNADGSIQYSKVVKVSASATNANYTIVNPIQDNIVIAFNKAFTGTISARNLLGKTIATATFTNKTGIANIAIPATTKGAIIITIATENYKKSETVIVQ